MNELEMSRKEITRIDEEMAKLFEARMKAAEKIAEYKKECGLPIKDYAREEELINRNRKYIDRADIEGYYVQFLRNTIDLSCRFQSGAINGMKVTYCGVEGAFSHIAAKRMFPEAELTSFTSFQDAYEAVERGEYDIAVLPLENSYAGEVGTVMDLIFSGSLYINQVIDVPIVQNLIGTQDATLNTVKKVISHPQALSQCESYLRRHNLESEAYSNTAIAAMHVKEQNDPSLAAIAADETSTIFGLKMLDSEINDSKNNTTRFAAFSRAQNKPAPSGKREDENFILVFTVQNEAGSLAQTLDIIGAHGYNMRNLRSRPMKDLLWNYFFYIEAEGNINTENGRDMLRELGAICAKLKLVGAYYVNNEV
ncbi:MAG: prephenate dehydratase domain-containing protein [Eubacteriales bacterium]|nr:prephenate dehydratase domain-containing protein [Eubacteriales bacterium]